MSCWILENWARKGESHSSVGISRLNSPGHLLILGQGRGMMRKNYVWLQVVPENEETGPWEAIVTA